MPGMGGKLRHERGRGHARLGVDLEQHQFVFAARRVVVTNIGPRHAAAAERLMRHKRELLDLAIDVARNFGRQDMGRAPRGIFRPSASTG